MTNEPRNHYKTTIQYMKFLSTDYKSKSFFFFTDVILAHSSDFDLALGALNT